MLSGGGVALFFADGDGSLMVTVLRLRALPAGGLGMELSAGSS